MGFPFLSMDSCVGNDQGFGSAIMSFGGTNCRW
jgi:hypothetical protein